MYNKGLITISFIIDLTRAFFIITELQKLIVL